MKNIWVGSLAGVENLLFELKADTDGDVFRVSGPDIEAFLKSREPSDEEYLYGEIQPETCVYIGGQAVSLVELIYRHGIPTCVERMFLQTNISLPWRRRELYF